MGLNMFKKSYYFIFILICLSLIPITCGYNIREQNELTLLESNKTFLIGTIFNPVESGIMVNASAISLVYYNYNLTDENIGLVQGFRKVSFEKQPFFFLYKPGPIGLIAYVFGYCTNFRIL
jgi:hypothetical protein